MAKPRRLLFALLWALLACAFLALFVAQALATGGLRWLDPSELTIPALFELCVAVVGFVIAIGLANDAGFAAPMARMVSRLLLNVSIFAVALFGFFALLAKGPITNLVAEVFTSPWVPAVFGVMAFAYANLRCIPQASGASAQSSL